MRDDAGAGERQVDRGVGRRARRRAAERSAGRRSRRPREVDQREPVGVVEPDRLGSVGDHRHRRASRSCRTRTPRARSTAASSPAAVDPGKHGRRRREPIRARREAAARRPRRSENRPISGRERRLEARRRRATSAPIASALNPSTSRRSGPSTFSTPKSSAGTRTNQIEARIPGRGAPRRAARRLWVLRACTPGVRQAATPRTDASTATLANAGPVPITDAIAAEHRPEERADDRGAHRGADRLSAALGRRGGDEPRERRPSTRTSSRLPAGSVRCRAARSSRRSRT